MSHIIKSIILDRIEKFYLKFTFPQGYEQWQKEYKMVSTARNAIEEYKEINNCWFRYMMFGNGQYDETTLYLGKHNRDGVFIHGGVNPRVDSFLQKAFVNM